MTRTRFTLLACSVFCWNSAAAVEWEFEPEFSIAETFTDNLQLSADAVAEDEFITEILPAINLRASGKQFELDFQYRLQGLLYSRNDDFDETLDYSSADGLLTLIDDALFISFRGSLNQQIINPGGPNAISAVSRTGNRSEVLNFSVSPYWSRELGNTSRIMIGYTAGIVEYDSPCAIPTLPGERCERPLPDSDNGRITAEISGSPPRSPWAWKVNFTESNIDYDTGSEVTLGRVGAELAWALGSKTQMFVGGGEENNEFRQSGARKIDGAFWNVGLRGQLDRLTNYEFHLGEEYFGNSYGLSLLRTAGKLTTDVSYLEETTTAGYQQQDYEALFEFLTNIGGIELPEASTSVYVRKRLSATATLELARSRVRLNAYNEDRDYLDFAVNSSDGVTGVALSWTWTARPRNEFSVDMGWQQLELRANDNTPEDVRLQLRYEREISDSLSVNVRLWSNQRFATISATEYDANAISIGLRKRF